MNIFKAVTEDKKSIVVQEIVSGHGLDTNKEYFTGTPEKLVRLEKFEQIEDFPQVDSEIAIYQEMDVCEFDDMDHTFKKYDTYFPMAVFGTLKKSYCNSGLMRGYKSHCHGFIPNFKVEGLSIYYEEGHAGICEVFFYDLRDWKRIIPAVDNLESFSPHSGGYHYLRTLMNIRLVPDNDERFPVLESEYSARRNRGWYHSDNKSGLNIPADTWDTYLQTPCWIYSNANANVEATHSQEEDPVLFCGHS